MAKIKVLYDPHTCVIQEFETHLYVAEVDLAELETTEEQVQYTVAHGLRVDPVGVVWPPKSQPESDNKIEESYDPGGQVWVCYVTDNYDNPVVVKVVRTEYEAKEWLRRGPTVLGKDAPRERSVEGWNLW